MAREFRKRKKEEKKREGEGGRDIGRRMINYACKLLCKSIGRG